MYLGSYLKDEWWVGMDPETGEEGCFPANFVADEGSEAAEKAIARVKAKAKKAAAAPPRSSKPKRSARKKEPSSDEEDG